MTPEVTRNRRLLSLWTEMVFQENKYQPRTVPSPYTLIKAEFGYTGTRQEVMDRVCHEIRSTSTPFVERAGAAR